MSMKRAPLRFIVISRVVLREPGWLLSYPSACLLPEIGYPPDQPLLRGQDEANGF